jgi:hypothetical protein
MKSSESASLQEYKSTNVVEAASRILGRPYQRSSSASGTKPTIIASRTQQTPAERTKIAIFLPTHDKKPSHNIVEQEITDERQQAFEASHTTVGDGCTLACNNDTGEFRLVGKEAHELARRSERYLAGLYQRERILCLFPSSVFIHQRWNGAIVITAILAGHRAAHVEYT